MARPLFVTDVSISDTRGEKDVSRMSADLAASCGRFRKTRRKDTETFIETTASYGRLRQAWRQRKNLLRRGAEKRKNTKKDLQ